MTWDDKVDRNRRRALQALAAGGVLALGLHGRSTRAAGMMGDMATAPPATAGQGFSRPLPIPRQLSGQVDAAGVRKYALRAGAGHSELAAGLSTPTWGYNGPLLGPTLRVPRGQPLSLRVENGLAVPTTLHWHGARIPGRMDGGPHNLIAPGGVWTPSFTLDQPAATLWYHPHPDTFTGPQVYSGLAGFLLVDDGDDERLGLPATYGVDDIPVVLQDRRLEGNGRLAYMTSMHDMMGMKGNLFLVNGIEKPYAAVPAGRLRLRLLNGSNARPYNLRFADSRDFHLIAGDAGLLEHPIPVNSILLAPGERVEILVDLSKDPGRALMLQSDSGAVIPSLYRMPMAADGYDRGRFDLLELRVGAPSGLSTRLPARLAEPPRTDKPEVARDLVLNGMNHGGMMGMMRGANLRGANGPGHMRMGIGGQDLFAINGEFMRMDTINIHASLGHTELWRIRNQSTMAHPIHLHGTSFVIRSRNGASPPPSESGWKDVVLVRPGESVELAVPLHHKADAKHPYMYHCHILEHEDNGMMGQFTVT